MTAPPPHMSDPEWDRQIAEAHDRVRACGSDASAVLAVIRSVADALAPFTGEHNLDVDFVQVLDLPSSLPEALVVEFDDLQENWHDQELFLWCNDEYLVYEDISRDLPDRKFYLMPWDEAREKREALKEAKLDDLAATRRKLAQERDGLLASLRKTREELEQERDALLQSLALDGGDRRNAVMAVVGAWLDEERALNLMLYDTVVDATRFVVQLREGKLKPCEGA